ncbi:MAG: hypothetical protein IJN31_01535, partial [Peptococcaceae bacterium]|nr:hypothetical protein [Peptococcaceae bacterium]
MKSMRKVLAIILMLTMITSLVGGTAFAEEPETEEYALLTVVNVADEGSPAPDVEDSGEESGPYWTEETELEDGTTQDVTHAVLDNQGELVDIGEEPA